MSEKNENDLSNDPAIWTLKSRTLPPPYGGSIELIDAVKATPQPDAEARKDFKIDNLDSLKTMLKEVDLYRVQVVDELRKRFPVEIEELEFNGVTARKVTPNKIDEAFANATFINLHGGGYVINSGMASLDESIIIASFLQIQVISVDYRMPPDHPFPAAQDDAVAVYKKVLEDNPNEIIFLGGSSAGGGLTLSTVLRLKNENVPLPTALFAGTPWADLTKTGDSYFINEGVDRVIVAYDEAFQSIAALYAGGRDLKDPYLSPVYGDVTGFPPTFIITGTRDVFLSNSVRMDTKLRAADVPTKLIVLEGMSHGDYVVVLDAPEVSVAFKDLKNFFLKSINR